MVWGHKFSWISCIHHALKSCSRAWRSDTSTSPAKCGKHKGRGVYVDKTRWGPVVMPGSHQPSPLVGRALLCGKNACSGRMLLRSCSPAVMTLWDSDDVIIPPKGSPPIAEWVKSRKTLLFVLSQFPEESTKTISALSGIIEWTRIMRGLHKAMMMFLESANIFPYSAPSFLLYSSSDACEHGVPG